MILLLLLHHHTTTTTLHFPFDDDDDDDDDTMRMETPSLPYILFHLLLYPTSHPSPYIFSFFPPPSSLTTNRLYMESSLFG